MGLDIEELHVVGENIEFFIANHTQNLEVLKLYCSMKMLSLRGVERLAQLKRLRELELRDGMIYQSFRTFMDTTVMEALSNANICLHSLRIDEISILRPMNIVNFKSLHTLSLHKITCHNENDVISMLAQLPSLNKLELFVTLSTFSVAVIDAICKYNPFIKELALKGFEINSANMSRFFNLKSLHVLRFLDFNEKDNVHISENDLISLATNLPLLVEIEMINTDRSPSMTVDGLIKLVKSENLLKRIKLVGFKDLTINKHSCEQLLNAMRTKTGLSITICCRHRTEISGGS